MVYDVIVVGGGIAGLTSAAYLSKSGKNVLLCEKENKVGGLVNSFDYKGFKFDSGIRAFENSGVVIPMIKDLQLDVELMKSEVTIGIEADVIKVTSKEHLEDYKALLCRKFPGNNNDIEKLIEEIKKIMKYMDILYGIDNPILRDMYNDKEYIIKTLLPWLSKYLFTNKKIVKLNGPVDEYLEKITKNRSLIDIISQHFFEKTPTFFALSYFSLYLDYWYPKGGTGILTQRMESFIEQKKGEIKRKTEICYINTEDKFIRDKDGNEYYYKKLIWASDLKNLYHNIDLEAIKNIRVENKIVKMKEAIKDKKGGDSILTLYLTTNLETKYFHSICTGHFFYTPKKIGMSGVELKKILSNCINKDGIFDLLSKYYELTTYEISIPAMRDNSLAPDGKTGLIISTFIDYSIVKHIRDMGLYDEFKSFSGEYITKVLDKTIYKGLAENIIDKFISTPLTIERYTSSTEGAITGWAFTNDNIPVENRMAKVTRAANTPIPDVYQAGQWAFSPSGLPISILTGKLAADKAGGKKSNR